MQENGLAKGTCKLSGAVYQVDLRKENERLNMLRNRDVKGKVPFNSCHISLFLKAGCQARQVLILGCNSAGGGKICNSEMQCSQLSFWLMPTLLHVCQNLPVLFSLAYRKMSSLGLEGFFKDSCSCNFLHSFDSAFSSNPQAC